MKNQFKANSLNNRESGKYPIYPHILPTACCKKSTSDWGFSPFFAKTGIRLLPFSAF